MAKRFAHNAVLLTIGFAGAFGVSAAASPAALDMVIGAREVVKSEPLSDCNTKARTALNGVLQDAAEIGSGDTGEWQAYGASDASGQSSRSAAVHCYPLDNGYVVTFTCAVQTPPSADTAAALCTKIAAAFGAKAAAAAFGEGRR